jgi:hypothetical protein
MNDDTTNQPAPDTQPANTPAPEGVEEELEIDDDLLADAGLAEEQTDEELAEIEHDGKKYRVPAALKDGYLRNADYTQKTQSVAEMRREVEAEKARVAEMGKLRQEDVAAIGQIVNLDTQLKAFREITQGQWALLDQQDPARAQQLFRQMSLLKEQRDELVSGVQQRQEQLKLEEQRMSAKFVEENKAALKRLIPNWTPELGRKVADAGMKHFGLTEKEIQSVTDARFLKILHYARIGHEALNKSRAATKTADAVEANPVPQVAARRSAPTNDLSKIKDPDEWLRVRNKQLAAQQRQRRG